MYNSPNLTTLIKKVWFRLKQDIGKHNQSIVISGESGSGKTYSAVSILKFISSIQKNKDLRSEDEVINQIEASIPLLTAFGKILI